MARRSIPEVNAGSMADIAFLLLIFFLVTTDITSNPGIVAKLPPRVPKQEQQEPPINERNLFVVLVNKNNQLFVEDRLMDIKDLRKAAIEFLDNGGGKERKLAATAKGNMIPLLLTIQTKLLSHYKMTVRPIMRLTSLSKMS